MFGSKRDEIKGECRKLHYEERNDLNSPNIIRGIKQRGMRWAGHVTRMGSRRGAYKVLVGKPEAMRPHERRRSRWDDNTY
jgi:hypothetical protein